MQSRVHRPAYIDYVGIKRFDENGKVIGEDRFTGLFSSSFYNKSATDVPVLKSKINHIMEMCDFAKGTHAYKAVLNILETYPRDELVQGREAELLDVAMGVLQIQERDMCRLFVRKDPYGRFFSCMVYVPRERYNTALRGETQELLAKAFGSNEKVDFTTFFSESTLARTHYIVRVADNNIDYNVKDIENNLIEAARTWEDKLQSTLLETAGESRGNELNRKYTSAFPRAYKDEVLPSAAVVDIEKLEMLDDKNKLEMLFYRPQEEANTQIVRLSLFHKDVPIHLSDVMPMLENFGLRVIGETPYAVKTTDGSVNWVMDFSMLLDSDGIDDLMQCIKKYLPENIHLYSAEPEEKEMPDNFFISELVREKIIRSLGDELPHETYVAVETKAMEGKMLSIGVIIYVARDSQKSIVIGHQGTNLKRIGQQTRVELEKMIHKKVLLKTFVKVNKNWNNDAQYLSSLGVGSNQDAT